MTESEFIALTDSVLERIGNAIDAVDAVDNRDADIDWQLNDGILEIDCGDAADSGGSGGSGGKIIVNRHVPNREIWLATRGGGYHFKQVDGAWKDTRGAGDLPTELRRALKAQAGVAVGVDLSE